MSDRAPRDPAVRDLAMRHATAEDLPAIVALLAEDEEGRHRETPGEPLDPGYHAAFAAIAAAPDQWLLVAEQGGAIVGTMQLGFLPGLSYRGAWRGQIEAVRVAGSRRGQGLGAAMIRWAIDRCGERGCRTVQLTSKATRIAAHRFYARLGFVPSHTGMKLDLMADRRG